MMDKKGFTLVELLVVVVIIGILVALILPNTLRAIGQANTKECASNLRSIDTAIQMFYTENRTWPTATADLTPYFPDNIAPVCHVTGAAYTLAGAGATTRADKAGHFTAIADWPLRHDQ